MNYVEMKNHRINQVSYWHAKLQHFPCVAPCVVCSREQQNDGASGRLRFSHQRPTTLCHEETENPSSTVYGTADDEAEKANLSKDTDEVVLTFRFMIKPN